MTTMLTIKILFTINSLEKKKGKKLFIKIIIILYYILFTDKTDIYVVLPLCADIIIILFFGWNVFGYFCPSISVNKYPKASNQT